MIWILGIFIWSSSAGADWACRNLFDNSHWNSTLQKIERLNNSGELHDVILVQNTPLTKLIRRHRLGDLVLLVNEKKRLHQDLVFFDEINLAVALGYNDIARFLINASTYPYARTPLGEDLLTTALYFQNAPIYSALTVIKHSTHGGRRVR